MEFLDGDDGLLKSRGRTALRDIVQFVEFNKFKNKPVAALAAETLAEIPGQFTDAMKKLGLKPIGK
jgi:predicted lipoprotein